MRLVTKRLAKGAASAALGLSLALSPALSSDAYAQDLPKRQWLDVEVGQSNVQKSSRPFARVLISDPDIAEIKLLEEGQFSIRGLAVGTTDLWIWYRDDVENPEVIELTVHRDLSELIRRIGEIVDDGSPPRVYPMEEKIVVDGSVADLLTLERVAMVAEVYDPEFVNLMSVRGDQQVQLEVVFAEVSRSALREMGLNFLWSGSASDMPIGAALVNPGTTGDRGAATTLDQTGTSTASTSGFTGSTAINSGVVQSVGSGAFALFGVLGDPVNLTAVLSVLEEHNITKILAEPTLVALSGQQADFLAGGEIPVPVAQQNNRISLEFKEYGVKLSFVPTVLDAEVIDMRVYVEVSEVDTSTGTRITGIEIPGFLTRKGESHLRLSNGMTFAMAGLLTDSMRYGRAQVPLLGDIPIIGTLFAYTSHIREETELMIFVTPRLVRPMAEDQVPAAPGTTEDNNPNDFELFWLGMDHRAGSRTADPTGPVGMQK